MDSSLYQFFPTISTPRVVYDDGCVMVVAKPAGMHCAPASAPDTLCSWLFSRYPAVAAVSGRGKDEGGLLHRLDVATSGLVAFATDDDSFEAMMAAAASGSFIKTYRALGRPSAVGLLGSKPETTSPMGVDEAAWGMALRRGDLAALAGMLSGRYREGRYRPFGPGGSRVACCSTQYLASDDSGRGKNWAKDTYRSDFGEARAELGGVLVEVRLVRGFRHQIRAHMAWMGLPLKGDEVYGDDDTEGSGLCLRAIRLCFPAAHGGTPIVVDLD